MLLLLVLPPCFVGLHVAMLYSFVRESLPGLLFVGGLYMCALLPFLVVIVVEARTSQLGRILAAEEVEVDGVAEFIRRRAADDAPEIEFLVSIRVLRSCPFVGPHAIWQQPGWHRVRDRAHNPRAWYIHAHEG